MSGKMEYKESNCKKNSLGTSLEQHLAIKNHQQKIFGLFLAQLGQICRWWDRRLGNDFWRKNGIFPFFQQAKQAALLPSVNDKLISMGERRSKSSKEVKKSGIGKGVPKPLFSQKKSPESFGCSILLDWMRILALRRKSRSRHERKNWIRLVKENIYVKRRIQDCHIFVHFSPFW